MPDENPGVSAAIVERARLRGRRMAHAVVITIAVAFIGASALQIARAVFGYDGVPVTGWQATTTADRACATGLRDLVEILDRADPGPLPAGDVDDAPLAPPQGSLLRPSDRDRSISQACAASPEGLDAWAALERLRSARELITRRSQAELGPLRRDLLAHLPADLR
jgi:hypothetical protein